ncbi:Elongin-A [Beauveria bassiana]|nr:Elongin-A [Beauveria bassiana]KAH8720630.1 Elongin-A [Beauveria bassiana]
MPVKSLYEMATAVAVKNIESIVSIGYLSYASVRHILLKVDNARQLRQIELNCPQLHGETGELWLRLIEKDFPLEFKAKAYMPKSQDKWFKVWEKYKVDHDRSIRESEEQLRAALMGLRQDKEKNTSKIVEGRFLPSDAIRPKKRNGPKDHTTGVLTFGGGSRTKTLTGAGVMRKARREAREVRNIQGALSRSVVAPIRLLEKQHLKAPPPAMVRERRIAAQPAFRTPETEEREQRLQELEKKRAAALEEHSQRAAYITDSEEDSDMDQEPTYKPPKQRVTPVSATLAGPSSASTPGKPTVPGRKVIGSRGSMFQRKFGAGKSVKSPTKPVRVTTTTTTTTTASRDMSPTAKKRTTSSAKLDEPAAGPSKRPATEPAQVSPNRVLPRQPSPDTARSMSLKTSPEAPKVLMRKKKPVNVFMKRPVRR